MERLTPGQRGARTRARRLAESVLRAKYFEARREIEKAYQLATTPVANHWQEAMAPYAKAVAEAEGAYWTATQAYVCPPELVEVRAQADKVRAAALDALGSWKDIRDKTPHV